MKKNTIYFILFALLLNFSFGQNLKDKNILVVWGGWEGHKPELFVKHIEKWLIFEEANYKIHNGLEAYNSYEELIKYDLIIQSITMSKISKEQENNLLKAIKNGVGIGGAHGGLTDSFRESTNYQFMVGGQWVDHPGGEVNFKVKMLKDELTKGLNDFEIKTEQYYMHYDPNIKVIANTKFNDKYYPWIDGVVMPVAWKKEYGNGKVFYVSIGHDPDEFINEENAWKLLTRGLKWATR